MGSEHSTSHVRVAAVGDSLTRSWPEKPGWVRTACADLQLDLVIESAEVGARARRVREEFLLAALATRPDVCVVLAGANDVGAGHVPILDLARIWVRVHRSGVRLIVATLPPHELKGRAMLAQLTTNTLIRVLARLLGWPDLVELTGPLGGRRWVPRYSRDHGHPSPEGKLKMAEVLTPALARAADEVAAGPPRPRGRSLG